MIKNFIKKKSGEIPSIKYLYFVIFLAIFGLLVINLEINFVWLSNFGLKLKERAINYEIAQAQRAAAIMQEAADVQIYGIKQLAFNIALVGKSTSSADILIEQFLKNNNHARTASIINLNGQEIKRYSRSKPSLAEKMEDYAHLELFERAMAGETFISRVNYTEYAEPFIIITAPVINVNTHAILSVLKVQYFLRGIWEEAIEYKIGDTGRISVVDGKGMLVADPNPSRALKKTSLLSIPPVKATILGRLYPGSDYINEKGVNVIGVGVPIKFGRMNWGVIVEQDYSEIESLTAELTDWLFLLMLGNFAVVLILIWSALILARANKELIKRYGTLNREKARSEEEKNKTDAMISNFLDPVVVISNDGRILLFNPAAKNILKLSGSDFGRKIEFNKNKFSLNCFKDIFKVKFSVKEIETDKNNSLMVEEIIIYPDTKNTNNKTSPFNATGMDIGEGENVYRVMTASVCGSDKVCYGYMKIFYNITRERKIDQLKSEFISIAAHQLRTPLSAIKWVFKMIIDGDIGPITEEQSKVLARGYQSNERIIGLVNDMLDVSRIEEGRYGYSFEKCDFLDILDEALEIFDNQIQNKLIRLKINRPKNLPKIYIDKEKIALTVQNVIENAVKYTPEYGNIEINILKKNNNIIFKVKDNGVGIPAKDQEKLFSKFFRAENVVRMQTEGSGLGLFIVKNVIEKHGGSINYTSEEGIGTEFTITLPI